MIKQWPGDKAVQLGSYAGEKPERVIVDCKMSSKLCSTFSVPDQSTTGAPISFYWRPKVNTG